MDGNDDLRQRSSSAHRGRGGRMPAAAPLAALLAVVAVAAGGVLLLAGDRAGRPAEAAFLNEALGARDASAPLVRTPAPGVRVHLRGGGYTVAGPAGSVGLRAVQNGGPLGRHANGVSQTTPFGSAAVVVDRNRTEQFLTVTRRQGLRTWRWQLETGLVPRVGADGAVVFLSRSSRRVAGPVLEPVEILDARGRVVTPEGARWSTGRNRHGWELRLTLDDRELPLPYVIDPAVTHRATTVSDNGAAGANNVDLVLPPGVAQDDLLVATIAVRGGVTVATPAGWSAGRVSQNGTNVRLFTFYKIAGASEPASQAFTWGGTQQAVGAISAYYGVKSSLGNPAVLDVMGAAATGNSNTASAASITTLTADALVLASYGINNDGTFGPVAGMTERWDAASASATLGSRASGSQHDMTQAAPGATGAKSSALGATRRWAAHQHSFEVDDVNPTITPTTPAVGNATLNLTSTVADADSGVASVLYERSPAGAGTWTTVGTSTTSPFSFPFDTTAVADGLYDIRATVTDWAGNTATATGLLRVDNSSPDQNPLTLTPLTGTTNQYWDGTNRVLYYNPTVAGTFSLSSVPRDVIPPISFVGGSGGANNNSPLTLTVPAGVQAGDLLLAQVGYERTTATSVPTPAGWTRHVDRDNGTIYGQVIFYRWATASEPASYAIPHASPAASISGTLLAYRGVASASPVLVNDGTVASGTTLTAPSVTTPAGCGRLVAFYGLWNTATLTTPAGMTLRATAINTEAGWNSRVLAADEILGAAGATGTRVSTATVTGTNTTGPGSNVSELLALRPLACVSSVQYPAPGQTGFTGGGNTDTVEPYAASPDYSFGPANTVEPGARTITISDEAGNPALTQTITFTRDVAAPTTTDDTGAITNAWRNVDTTVTLSPGDGAGAGVEQTYYTTDGSTPTTASPTGTSVLLTAEGTYTIKYFSTDRVANTESVRTGTAQIRIDKTNPTAATLDPLPVSIRNGQSLTGGGADALSNVGSITYLYCAGAACTPGTAIGSSSTAAGGYAVTWNGQPADGTYRVRARVFDAAGNQLDSAIQTVTIDNTNPSGSVTAPAAGANVRGSSVSVASDSADGSGSGVASALFQRSPAGAGIWTTIGSADTTSPYGVTWDTTAVADGLYDLRVVTTDNAGNASTSATIANVRVDNANPSGSVTAPAAGANVRGASVAVTSDSADGESGVADALFQSSPAGAGTWTTIGSADTTSPYGVTWDTTAVADGLYDLRVVTTDNAGNAATSATVANVRVDNGLPTQTLSLTAVSPAGAAYLTGTDLFYRGAAAGQLRIRNAVSDGGSGPASSTTSALGGTSTGWTHTPGTVSTPAGGPYDSSLLSWSAGTTTSPTVDVNGTDAAGNDAAAATLTLRNDSTAPTGGALTVNGVAATAGGTTSDSDGSFTIGVRTDWSETASATASGLASSTLTRESATFANGTCGSYGGSTVIVGSPAQSLAAGCYRYTLAGVDNVGNSVSVSTVVRVHGAVDRFAVEAAGGGAIGSQTAGSPFAIRVTALDADGNTVTSFGGTVDVTSSGGLSAGGGTTATFTSGVLASHSVTLTSAGSRTITATRTSGGAQSGTSAAFSVGHASLSDFLVEAGGGGPIGAQTVDAPFAIRVTARDAYGNTVTSFDGAGNTVDVTSSGTLSAGGGTTAAFTSGVLASHSVTASSPGATTLTATRTSGGAQNGASASFNVGNATFTQNAPAGVTGTAKVGQTLTRAAGNWSPAPTGRSYQWRRCDGSGAGCADIAGATGTTYTLAPADLGATIRVVETVSRLGYDDAASTSAATGVVAAGDLQLDTAVSITGTARVGATLTRAAAAWTPSPDSRSYQWRRCDASGASCADIAGATGTTYDLVAADLGATVRVVETATKAAYADGTSTSSQTGVVALGDFTPGTAVSIMGTAQVAQTLSVAQGSWTPSPDARSYQWRLCDGAGNNCADISGETGTTYVVRAGDVGSTIRVVETASKTAYTDASATSAATAAVTAGDVTNTSVPTVSGTEAVGRTLTATGGTWTPAGTTSAFQWIRCDADGSNCAPIAGATGTTYELAAADLGKRVKVRETASKPGFTSGSADSALTGAIAAGTLSNTAVPSVSGTEAVGQTLTAASGSWSPAPDSTAYQWIRCDADGSNCAPIAGATGSTYVLAAADLGKRVGVQQTASKTAYDDDVRASPLTGAIAAGTLSNSGQAAVTGTATVGETLTRVAATWSPAPDSRSYQWRRCDASGASCADIAGATGTTYDLVAADLGATIRLVETASKAGYTNAVSTSAQTAAVAAGTMTEATAVAVSGTAKVGETLTRAAAAWTPSPDSRSYQWRRCDASGASCADIAGATGTTYDLVAADLGATIRVVETASKAGYTNAVSTSAQTAVVAAGTIASTAAPTVSGSATTTSTLTATRGTWTPSGTSGAFQWVRCDADGSNCADIAGATASTYVVAAADVGKKLKVRETASKAGYTDASADSALTGVVVDTDVTPPTNTITLAAADGAYLSGTTVFYNGAAGGSLTLSSAVADAGSGPGSAVYPPLFGYAGGTVSTPAGGPFLSGSIAWSAGTTGSLPYVVTARDAWTPANESQTTLTIADDSTGPAASAQCNGAACSGGWYTSAPVSVTLAGDDGSGSGVAQLRYTLDGSDPTAVSGFAYAAAFDVTGQGVTTAKARAFDRVGNAGAVTTITIRIDTVAPQTTLDSTPAAATPDTTPTFAYSADEASTFQWRLDGGSWTTDAGPVTLGPLADGTYLFEVRATDVAGNVDASPASFTFTVDTAAADTTVTSAPPAATNATAASFSFTATDAGPSFDCRLDGGAWTACTSPESYSGLTEASHTFEVRARDAAGNVDPTPASRTWTIDLTAPDTSFLSTPADPSANPTPTFGLGSTESPSTFECRLDGGAWSPCATPFTTPPLGDGSHTLQVRATDAAGNTDASAVAFTWLVDATAPTGSITNPLDGAGLGGSVALASDSADAGGSGVATVVFQRTPAGGSTWTNQAPSWDTTLVADGDYDLRVVTTDNAGNAFTSPVITVTVDNTEPSLSVTAPNPVNLATADPATVTATAADGGTGIANVRFDQCAEDSPACVSDSWVLLAVDTGAPYSAAWPIPSDGPRLLRVRATDNAGRQRTELVLVTVDRIRPTGSLTAPAAGANLRGATVALAATASDTAPGTVNAVTFQVSPAGAGSWSDVGTDSAAPYTGTLDTTALVDGLYDLRVFTTDAAGNAEAAPATVQVRVDNTSPTGSVTSPAGGANLRGTVTLTSSSADGGSGVATVQFERSPAGAGAWTTEAASFDTTSVADGLYDLRVTTTDNAGNSFTSASVEVRVDNTSPTGSVTSPAAGANLRGTVTLTSSSADSGSGVATVQFQRSPAGAGAWTTEAAGFDTTAVVDGLYDLRVTTTDNAGNSFTSGAVQVRVDNTDPTGSVTAPANGAEIGVAPVTLTSDSADTGSGVATVGFERSPAGAGTWTATPATWDTASGPDAVADGQYDLRVRTTDNAGNVFTSAAITVLVDHTAPTTTASLAPGSPSNAPVTVSFNASDGSGSGVSVVSYRVDGGSLQSGAAVVIPAPGDNSNDGAHLVEFFSTDEVGNVEPVKTVTVVIDTTAPSGTGGDPGDYLRGLATLTYATSATDVSSVQFQFSPAGAGAWTNVGAADLAPPYEASWNTTLVADGPYDLRAVVTDTTGNVANTLLPGLPKTVDNTAPSGSVTAPLAAAFVSGSVTVDASATDGAVPPASGVSAVRFEVKPAGAGAFSVFGTQVSPVVGSTYRQSLDTTSLADGPTELRVVVTDVAGNETTSATRTVNVDNDAPLVTLDDPGATVGPTATLAASASADTASVAFRYRAVGSGGPGTLIDTDTTAPFGVTWSTAPTAETQWELIAVATDAGGNTGTSAPRTVLVDRTQPTGSVTAPAASSTVGGPSVALAATAADAGGSGVVRVEWFVKVLGSSTFASVASDTTAPYTATWDATTAPDGAAEVRAEITDAAGNVSTTAVNPVTVDSTGPSVTLADPGAALAGTVALSATTGGGASRVVFSVSPADAGTWTQIGEDTTSPFGAAFDTTALADGLYDLRAIGYDALGNPSAPSLREDVRLDNTAPALVASTPADGSVSASANQIELTVSEPVTIVGATLDGGPAPAPAVSGTTITYPTGALADGLHVLFGWLEDAGGTRTPFRVALTVESTPLADRPPVEKSVSRSAATSAVAAGSLATVTVDPPAWPTLTDPADFLVVSVDPSGTTPTFGPGLTAASQIIEVTARWALAGTPVTEFAAPIEVLIPNTGGGVVIPATSEDGTAWRALEPVEGTTLPAGARDGYYVDAAGVHILTRHLTLFALGADVQGPTPPHSVAGEMRADGLTIRWIPGRDNSGRLGSVVLFVNGEPYRTFGPTEYEAKLGPMLEDDTRSFYLVQQDAAGNPSGKSETLRALPKFLGLGLDAARAALSARGIGVGSVTYRNVPGAVPGTVIGPENLIFFVEGGSVDLVVAGTAAAAAAETQLALQVANAKRIKVQPKRTTVPVSILVTRPATVTGTLFSAERAQLYTWRLKVAAGRTVVKLRLPAQVRRPGLYRIVWVARAGSQTVRRSVPFRLVGKRFQQVQAPKKPVEVVLTGGRDLRGGVGAGARIVATATPDRTFLLVASRTRNVTVVVVDVDRYGVRFVRDLHVVFPELRIVAVARRERTREASLKAGAARALPR